MSCLYVCAWLDSLQTELQVFWVSESFIAHFVGLISTGRRCQPPSAPLANRSLATRTRDVTRITRAFCIHARELYLAPNLTRSLCYFAGSCTCLRLCTPPIAMPRTHLAHGKPSHTNGSHLFSIVNALDAVSDAGITSATQLLVVPGDGIQLITENDYQYQR